MSRSARRLAPSVGTQQFNWQTASIPPASRPVPLVFAEVAAHLRGAGDPAQQIEARELHLPSVSAERLEAIEHRAYGEGYARGEADGRLEAARQLDETTLGFASTVQELSSLRVGIMRRADRELIHLALAMAERIIRREIRQDPTIFLAMARAAIERLGGRAAAVVHLHPLDYDAVVEIMPDRGGLDVVSDGAIDRGGCLIRSTLGTIDAGVDAQLRELSREMLGSGSNEETASGVPGL
jgi:flagellar assembly protein FliH